MNADKRGNKATPYPMIANELAEILRHEITCVYLRLSADSKGFLPGSGHGYTE